MHTLNSLGSLCVPHATPPAGLTRCVLFKEAFRGNMGSVTVLQAKLQAIESQVCCCFTSSRCLLVTANDVICERVSRSLTSHLRWPCPCLSVNQSAYVGKAVSLTRRLVVFLPQLVHWFGSTVLGDGTSRHAVLSATS